MSERRVRELFVWYRVEAHNAETLRAEVEALQRSLERRFPDLSARLLVRREAELETWMETFSRSPRPSQAPGGIDRTTEAAIAAAAQSLRPLLASDRHVEAFEVVRPAAER